MAASGIYDEVEIEDMAYDEVMETYTFPCPCGDKFFITKVYWTIFGCGGCAELSAQEQLHNGEDIATCPSCSLIIRIIYDPVSRGILFGVADGLLLTG